MSDKEGVGKIFFHEPVMVREILELLKIHPGLVVVDATLGGAGHAAQILKEILPGGMLIGIDRDSDAINFAASRLGDFRKNVKLVNGKMGEMKNILDDIQIESVDAILADLGVSSFQLDETSRGFSFMKDAPLDMRMNPLEGVSVADFIETAEEEDLEKIIRTFGEERFAGRIARTIVRQRGKIKTTRDLAELIVAATPAKNRHGRIHPATRTFQALRIAVNNEMGELENFLASAPCRLKKGGRVAVISYHSLEDRQVKHSFKKYGSEESFRVVTKKPVVPGEKEVEENPRSRSAKLRVLERIS